MKMIGTRSVHALISEISRRALELKVGGGVKTELDLAACHLNGNPLRLAELLDAEEVHFVHDVAGIQRHIDRATGALTDGFEPRYTKLPPPKPPEPETYSSILERTRESFRSTLERMDKPDEDDITEALDEAITEAMPSMNASLAEVLLHNLALGFPDDRIWREEADIFGAIRVSIEEDLRNDTRAEFDRAIEETEEDEEVEDPDDARERQAEQAEMDRNNPHYE